VVPFASAFVVEMDSVPASENVVEPVEPVIEESCAPMVRPSVATWPSTMG